MATHYPPAFVRETVDGKKVIKDEVMPANLPARANGAPVPMHTIRVLTLEDGSVVYGCRDCEFTADRHGGVRSHRNKEHGVANAHRRSPVNADASSVSSPPVPMPRADMLGMTLYEMLELAANISRWEQVFTNDQEEIERLRTALTDKDIELAERTRQLRAEQREHEKLKARIGKLLGMDAKPADDKAEEKP